MLKKILDFTLFGCIFISLCAVGLCIQTNARLNLPLRNFDFYLLIFGATLAQYNLHYLVKKTANTNSDRIIWSSRHKKTHLFLAITGSLMALYGVFRFEVHNILFLFILGTVTIIYSFPFLPSKNNKRLKDYGVIKLLTISLSWTLVTVWLPLNNYYEPELIWMVFAQRLVYMISICLVFDIRDVESDKKDGINTLPVLIGKAQSYFIAKFLLVVFALLAMVYYFIEGNPAQLLMMIISASVTWWLYNKTKKNNSDYLYLGGLDGMILLQSALVMLGSI